MSIAPVNGLDVAVGAAGARTPEQRAALGFERQLLLQLTEQLAKSAAPQDEESSAATKTYRDMLPGALADALTAAGGVGLAARIAKEAAR